MLALSIRQPFAELILRGVKTVEYRSRPTRVVGRRFHLYAPLKIASADPKVWSRDLSMPADGDLPEWMIELAEQVGMIEPGTELPRGVIVGSAVIREVRRQKAEGRSEGADPPLLTSDFRLPTCLYEWHLADVERFKSPRKPKRHPQPVWFRPF